MAGAVTLRGSPIEPVVRALRARLERLDRELVLALAERERVQWELLTAKRSFAIPLDDPDQVLVVRRRAREWAVEFGADPALAERVVRAALTSGVRRFRSEAGRASVMPGPSTIDALRREVPPPRGSGTG